MTQWRTLLDRLLTGLQRLQAQGFVLDDWVLGGGTALMIAADHRLSRDIDVFIHSPEYLPYLSPRLGGEAVWACNAYEEAANFLKLRFPEGEIDFIVAGAIGSSPPNLLALDLPAGAASPAMVPVEHPVEIALKKLFYRGSSMLVRDAFDICVVDALFEAELLSKLHLVAERREAIAAAVQRLAPEFVQRSLDELDILPGWRGVAQATHERIGAIVGSIPHPPPR